MTSGMLAFCLKNVLRGRSRVFFCILAVAVGVLAVTLLDTVGHGGQDLALSYLESLGFSGALVVPNRSVTRTSPLSVDDEELCTQTDGVKDAIAFTTRYGILRSGSGMENAVIWGVGSKMEHFLGIELLYGRFFRGTDQFGESDVIIVDDVTAKAAFGTERAVGRMLQLSLDGKTRSFVIVGIVHQSISALNAVSGGQIPTFVYIPLSSLFLLTNNEEVSEIALLFDDKEKQPQISAKICRMLDVKYENESVGYSVINMDETLQDVNRIMMLIRMLLVASSAVSLLVSGIGVMNAMLSSVKERRKEIGLCLAVGASPGQIALEFILEAGFLSAIGGLIGASFGIILGASVNAILGLPFRFFASSVILSIAVVIVTGMSFGTVPAIRAARLCPMDSLRTE